MTQNNSNTSQETISFMIYQDKQYPDGFMLVRCVSVPEDPEGWVSHVMAGNGIWVELDDETGEAQFTSIYESGDYPKWAVMEGGAK